ncbi:hypothetical protein QKW35_14005 [Pontibacterium granulatum]|uniref:hypothetical protein n=1 Tax=Pontibacterium TaxID=2036025 RepID=UPI00249B0B81|nr:hypothetical protein [Pontibacterium granulatum]MDI3325492.1 hypothetical protein [Pontibacterium granulatum]
MFSHWLKFLLMLLAPGWMQDRTPDESHFYRRQFTSDHRKKRKKVRYIWLSAASVCLLQPSLPMFIFVGLLSTFLSFSLLDESS